MKFISNLAVVSLALSFAVGLNDPYQTIEGSHITAHTTAVYSGLQEDLNHPCLRPCLENTPKKTCHYNFTAEWYITMSKACYNCPYTLSDCFRPHCVVTDGQERAVVTVNRRLPGPSIQVCEGDEIVVDLKNDLMSDTTSLHWHGLHQKGTPYMDGVPHLTQCPILPGTTFRYHFLADRPSTNYWHSHSGFQRADGMFGALVIRPKGDSVSDLYDVDDPTHVLMITDWMDKLGIDKFVNHHHTTHENKPYNLLVNGLGKYQAMEKEGKTSHMPIYEVRVQKNKRYRFRSISNAIQNCPIEMSIDNHTLLLINSDGNDLEPKKVDSLVIYAGERFDFVVEADQEIGTYWFKFRGLLDCDERFTSAHQLVLLRYEGASGLPTPLEDVNYQTTRREGFQVNSLNKAPGDLETFITAADLRSKDLGEEAQLYNREPDHKFWISYDFYARDNDWFHHKEFYSFYGVKEKLRMYVPQMNNISLKLPNAPPLSQPTDFNQSLLCNSSTVSNCDKEFCHCTHTLNLELGSLVEIILVDTGVVYYANHPFHIHGHVFAVVGMGRLGEETTLEKVKELDKEGKLQRNLVNPVLKDSVTVPDGGYTIIRFIADNPGYWLFHCHLTFHVEVGMAIVLHIGNQLHLPPIPKDFPKCGSWKPEPVKDLAQTIAQWKVDILNINLIDGDKHNTSYNTSTGPDSGSGASQFYSSYALLIVLSIFLVYL